MAQPAPAPAPPAAPAAVPDQMPFDIPYGASINADQAAKAIAATIAEASKSPRSWKLAIAVVDPAGELVGLQQFSLRPRRRAREGGS